jgi:hypothetical protein
MPRDFHGEKRKNDAHSSITDPDAMPGGSAKGAGKEAKLCHMGHLMMENRNGLIVDARLTEANGTAERTTAFDVVADNARPAARSAATRTTIPPTSWPAVENVDARRMSRKTTPIAVRQSTHAPPGIPAIASAQSSASGSKRRSAG